MDEFEEPCAGARGAQSLDHAVRNTAAAVNRDARGFVDRDEVLVLVEHREPLAGAGHGRRGDRGRDRTAGAKRRQPDPVAFRESKVRAGTPAVHSDFARTQDAVEVALRHPFERPGEKVVEALARGRLVDRDLAHDVVA